MNFEPKTDVPISSPKFFFYVESKPKYTSKEGVLHLFTVVDRPILEDIPDDCRNVNFFVGKGTTSEYTEIAKHTTVYIRKKASNTPEVELTQVHPSEEYNIYGIVPQEDYILFILLSTNGNVHIYSPSEEFYITSEMISNYTDKDPLLTDVGKFIVNQVLFAEPFGNKIPYQNKLLEDKKVDSLVSEVFAKGNSTRQEYNKFMDNAFWLLEQGSVFTAAFTEKTLTTSDEVLKRKKELLEEHKNELNDPNVLAAIESELLKMDKEYIKGDPSQIFLDACGGKAYKECRKKMYLLFGMSNTFGGGYSFTPQSLEDGWVPEALPTAFNEIRRGAYGRAIDTAKGGAETKFILRTFQEIQIKEEDCGDTRGIPLTLTEDNYKYYNNRYLTDGTMLDENNIKSYIGKTVKLRTPLTCKNKHGFCYKCCGEIFKKTNLKAIGMQTLLVTASFTNISMAAMHTSGISTTELTNVDEVLK